MLLTLRKKFICSTVLHTVFIIFASQLTAALPFSMRTSSNNNNNNNNNNNDNNNNDLEVAHPQSGSSSTLFLVEVEFGNA